MTRSSALALSFATLTALALPACSSSHGSDDAGILSDGAVRTDVPIDGSLRPDVPTMACGTDVCESGEICCSGCPGDPPLGCFEGGCPPIGCPAAWLSCEDALASGGGSGERCEFDGRCERDEGCCQASLACTDGALDLQHTCAPGCLVCASNEDCASDSYCDGGDTCGGPGTCLPRPTACPEDCPGVCSCDGDTFCNGCGANAEGANVAHPGPCEMTECAPQDARGEGACEIFFGYVWDGTNCTGIGGCSCIGADCGALYDSPDACDAVYAGCFRTF